MPSSKTIYLIFVILLIGCKFAEGVSVEQKSALEQIYISKGNALVLNSNYSEANQAYREAIEINPQLLIIKIIKPEPKERNGVSNPLGISGISQGNVPQDHYIWILVSPSTAPGLWWPQANDHLTLTPDGIWNWQVTLGGDADKNSDFTIAAVLVNNETDVKFLDWLGRGIVSKSFPGLEFPDNAEILDAIKVTRQEAATSMPFVIESGNLLCA